MNPFIRAILLLCFAVGTAPLHGAARKNEAPVVLSRDGGGVQWKDLAELKAAATKGNPEAWAQLGEQLLRGDGAPKDGPQALTLLEKAARAGIASAAFRLGMLLDDGDGVARDRVRALGYFRSAAAGGAGEAFHNVGAAYVGARGVRRDYTEGLAWLILAKKHNVGAESEAALRTRILALKRPEWIPAAEKRATEIERELAAAPPATFLPAEAPLVYVEAAESSSPTPAPPAPPAPPRSR